MHFYPFNIKDFALHTSHLSLEEEGVYRRMLDYYYDTEGPIPEETQPVIRRLRLGLHCETFALVLEEFFTLEEDGWHNYRADIEIDEYQKRAGTARENGKKGGRPKINKGAKTQSVILANPEETQKKPDRKLPVTITSNQEPVTITSKDKAKRFIQPTISEVTAYCLERNNSVDPARWIDHYTSNGWKVGKNPMKDWKAAVRTWENKTQDSRTFKSNADQTRTKNRTVSQQLSDRSWAGGKPESVDDSWATGLTITGGHHD